MAKNSFNELKSTKAYADIVETVSEFLKTQSDYENRVNFIHKLIDDFNEDVFNHPLVKQFSPCKAGCSACCHTQVSVTQDEALNLRDKVQEGTLIDLELLKKQMKTKDSEEEFYKLSYEERKCVFLDNEGKCKVYANRPSVCRTNAVLGEASQCEVKEGPQKTVLVKTSAADMVIYASYQSSSESGTLAHLLGNLLLKEET